MPRRRPQQKQPRRLKKKAFPDDVKTCDYKDDQTECKDFEKCTYDWRRCIHLRFDEYCTFVSGGPGDRSTVSHPDEGGDEGTV